MVERSGLCRSRQEARIAARHPPCENPMTPSNGPSRSSRDFSMLIVLSISRKSWAESLARHHANAPSSDAVAPSNDAICALRSCKSVASGGSTRMGPVGKQTSACFASALQSAAVLYLSVFPDCVYLLLVSSLCCYSRKD